MQDGTADSLPTAVRNRPRRAPARPNGVSPPIRRQHAAAHELVPFPTRRCHPRHLRPFVQCQNAQMDQPRSPRDPLPAMFHVKHRSSATATVLPPEASQRTRQRPTNRPMCPHLPMRAQVAKRPQICPPKLPSGFAEAPKSLLVRRFRCDPSDIRTRITSKSKPVLSPSLRCFM